MNKRAEQDFAELVIAVLNGNAERAGRILTRTDERMRERWARTLGGTMSSVLLTLPPKVALSALDDLGFEVKKPGAAPKEVQA